VACHASSPFTRLGSRGSISSRWRRSRCPSVTWHSTYSALTENTSYCHWEAPTREAILEILKKYEIPYEVVHEVRRFDPTTGLMEPAPVETKVLSPA